MINLSSRHLELIIGSQDWTNWLDADSGIQIGYPEYGVGTGLLAVEGTITLTFYYTDPNLPSIPNYRTNPNQWRRGQQISIRVANSSGALTYLPCSGQKLYITKPPQRPKKNINGTATLVLQVGCRLALEYFPPEPNRDVSGIVAGVELDRGTIISNILNYISVPNAIDPMPYGIAYPLPKVTGNWLQMCGQLADSAGYHLRCDVSGVVIAAPNNLDRGGGSANYLIGRDEEIWEAIGDIAEQPIEKLTVTGVTQSVAENLRANEPNQDVVIEEAPIGVVLPDLNVPSPDPLIISKRTTKTTRDSSYGFGNSEIFLEEIELIEEPIGVVLPDLNSSFPDSLIASKRTTKTYFKLSNNTWRIETKVEEPIGVVLPDLNSSFPHSLVISSRKTEPNASAPSADLVEPISDNIITEVQLKSEVTAQQLAQDGRARQRTIDVPFAVSVDQLTKYGQNYNKFLSGRALGWRFAGALTFNLLPFSQVSVTDGDTIYFLKVDAIQYAINREKAYCLWHGIEVGIADISTPDEITRPVIITMGSFDIIGTSSAICLFNPFSTGQDLIIGTSSAAAISPFFVEPIIGTSNSTAINDVDPPIIGDLLSKTIAYFKFDDTSNTLYSYDSTTRFEIYSQYNTATYYTGKIGNAINRNTASPSYAMSIQRRSGTTNTPPYNFSGFVGIGFWFKVQERFATETYSGLLKLQRDGEIWDIQSSDVSVKIKVQNNFGTIFSAEIFKADFSPFYDEIYDPETGTSTITWNWQFILVEIDPINQLFRARLNNEALTTTSYTASVSSSERIISLPRFGDSMLIDELYLYDSTLGTTDRNSLYNSGNGLSYPFT